MAGQTYRTKAVVLKKTKLGETDLILTLLAADGQQIRAVCKGARKPTSTFASRLELFSVCDMLLVHGRNLDIVKEASLMSANMSLRVSLEKSSYASVCAELLCKLTIDGGVDPKLYPMSVRALELMDAGSQQLCACVCVAHMVKAFTFAGIGPQLLTCAGCGGSQGALQGRDWFSFEDGGYVCNNCHSSFECTPIEPATLRLLTQALYLPFDQFCEEHPSLNACADCFELLHQWCRFHLGYSLRSLNFILSGSL